VLGRPLRCCAAAAKTSARLRPARPKRTWTARGRPPGNRGSRRRRTPTSVCSSKTCARHGGGQGSLGTRECSTIGGDEGRVVAGSGSQVQGVGKGAARNAERKACKGWSGRGDVSGPAEGRSCGSVNVGRCRGPKQAAEAHLQLQGVGHVVVVDAAGADSRRGVDRRFAGPSRVTEYWNTEARPTSGCRD